MPSTLGPWSGVYTPNYAIKVYKNGNPAAPLTGVNLRSVTQITTSKSLDDVSGTFNITFKDRRVQSKIAPMDVIEIRFKGHNQGWALALRGVVDTPEPTGDAEVESSEADVTISGRCTGKYLQINSMFLPVWDPAANLPTALIFGMGDSSQKLGTGINAYLPRSIFGYIFDHYVIGKRGIVGQSGTPNARFWMSRTNRFDYVRNGDGGLFQVPFIQFDEDTCDTALTNLTVQGFTEGWVDEVGNIVYRRPQWDATPSWTLHTSGLCNWDLPKTDTAMATYVEVYPSGLPGLPSAQAQAMFTGRAPIPSDYVTGLQGSGFKSIATPQFIIDTDATGKVTPSGATNWYYQQQRKYGVRPYMITSPLLASRQQAQAQAEGLLRFMLRMQKSGTVTIPGEPNVRLGQTIYITGPLDDQVITRTYYIEGISHEYVEGDHYTTTLSLTHGRDPGDPGWQQMVLPNYSPSQLANVSGLLNGSSTSSGAGSSSQDSSYTEATSFQISSSLTAVRQAVLQACQDALNLPASDWTYANNGRPQPAGVTSWGQLGKPIATDCSGFATLAYEIGGAPDPNGMRYSQPGYTGYMEANGTATTTPQPGDLCFWSNPDHVAVYVGNGMIVEHGSAPIVLSTVTAENAYHESFLGYRTYLPTDATTTTGPV